MLRIDIEDCPECGKEHKNLSFNYLKYPPMVGGKKMRFVGQCPTTLGTIFKNTIPCYAYTGCDFSMTEKDYEVAWKAVFDANPLISNPFARDFNLMMLWRDLYGASIEHLLGKKKESMNDDKDHKDKKWTAHMGDPCIYCGTAHDAVNPGPCPARATLYGLPRDLVVFLGHAEQTIKDGDEARAQMIAAIGALQELSMDPELAGIPFYVITEPGAKVIIEPRKVENIFGALERHTKTLLPFGKEALNKAYKYDGLLLKAKDLQAEVENLRLMIAPEARADKRVDYKTIAEITRAQASAQAATTFENTDLRAQIERLQGRRTCVHVNVAGDCSVVAKNRKLEAEVARLASVVASSTIRHVCVHADHVPVRIWPDASVAGECSVMAEKRQLEDKLYKMLDTVEILREQLKAVSMREKKKEEE